MSVYTITHEIEYIYDRAVAFAPHELRLRPRSDVFQSTLDFNLTIDPQPQQIAESLDLNGNNLHLAWFDHRPSAKLNIRAQATVSTHLTNPFNYLLAPWATNLPIDYPRSLDRQLQPYLTGYLADSIDPIAAELAGEIWQAVDGNTVAFLSQLNRQIYQNCDYAHRDTGAALPPGVVWQNRAGSCRDLVVLFIEVCRAVGLAGRFVSGYEAGAETDVGVASRNENRHLHAWAEIYLPGGGWRGYDPTHGLLVAQNHIALVASPFPAQTTPVEGKLQTIGAIATAMSYNLIIQKP